MKNWSPSRSGRAATQGRRALWCVDLRPHRAAEPILNEIRHFVESQRQADLRTIGDGLTIRPTPTRIDEAAAPRWYPVIDYSRCGNCLECLNFCLFGAYGLDEAGRILRRAARRLPRRLPGLRPHLSGRCDPLPGVRRSGDCRRSAEGRSGGRRAKWRRKGRSPEPGRGRTTARLVDSALPRTPRLPARTRPRTWIGWSMSLTARNCRLCNSCPLLSNGPNRTRSTKHRPAPALRRAQGSHPSWQKELAPSGLCIACRCPRDWGPGSRLTCPRRPSTIIQSATAGRGKIGRDDGTTTWV